MGSLKDPKTWIPYINPKDCSQKVCNLYCTQWCKYVILPSPPPPLPEDDSGGATLSPVVIVVITLIGSFLLLIGYYVIILRYCLRNNESSVPISRGIENRDPTRDLEMGVDGRDEDHDPSNYVPWLVVGKGLDEAMIKSITICNYKKGDGLVSSTDCSVCLGEFEEDESVRLLPKCSHAFHVYCIDTWLKTHSNCPLCRANVCCDDNSSPRISPPPPPPPPLVRTSDQLGGSDATIEIREEGQTKIRRSKSMGYLCQNRCSRVEVLVLDQAKEMARQEHGFRGGAGPSENVLEGNNKAPKIDRVNHFDMKRSYSNGKYLFNRECG